MNVVTTLAALTTEQQAQVTQVTSAFDPQPIIDALVAILPWAIGIVVIIVIIRFGPIVFKGVIKAVRSVAGKLMKS